MAVIQMKGALRDGVGKGFARKARAIGRIPGVLYGHGETPKALAVDSKEFSTAMRTNKGSNAIVALDLGSGDVTALVRAVQLDPVSHRVLHIDFQHISLDETIHVEVPVHLVGIPIGVKEGGGVLEAITRELQIRCLPTAIPASLDVDVSGLAVGTSLHVRDLKFEGISIETEGQVTVATVVAPTVEAEPVAGAAAVAEPEVVGAKGKKDEAAGEKDKK